MPKVLSLIADNPLVMEELKKVLYSYFSTDDLTFNQASTNEILGQQVRSVLEGRRNVDLALQDIAAYKSTGDIHNAINPAR